MDVPRVRKSDLVQDQPDLQLVEPLVFADFNGDNQCMGYGLKSLKEIRAGADILRMKTQLGLTSHSLVDDLHGELETDEDK